MQILYNINIHNGKIIPNILINLVPEKFILCLISKHHHQHQVQASRACTNNILTIKHQHLPTVAEWKWKYI